MSNKSDWDDPKRYDELTDEQKNILLSWISHIDPLWIILKSSRDLCDQFYWSQGAYEIINGQMKGAFLALNWYPVNVGEANWTFKMRDYESHPIVPKLLSREYYIIAPRRGAFEAYLRRHNIHPSQSFEITEREHLLYLPRNTSITLTNEIGEYDGNYVHLFDTLRQMINSDYVNLQYAIM